MPNLDWNAGISLFTPGKEIVFFDFNKSDIKAEYHAKLNNLGTRMEKDTKARVVLAGYTDGVGFEGYIWSFPKGFQRLCVITCWPTSRSTRIVSP